ncbi:MAG: hypothetical protein ACFFB0_08880 [Promethearchaeota archaeon]
MPISKEDALKQANTIFKNVIKDSNLLSEVLKNVRDKEDSIRYPNALALEKLSEKQPEIIYPQWDFMVDLLKSNNAFHKSIAIANISNLTYIDEQNKFDKIFNEFFNLIDNKSVMITRKLVIYSGRIAKAKPSLRSKITKILLKIDETQHNQDRKDLIKGDIIETFSEYFKDIKEKKDILDFVRAQLNSTSPSAVKKAKSFLKRWK